MAADFDPYYTWLGIPAAEQPPNHYRLLGVSLFESDEQVIAHSADRQMGYIRTFQTGPHSAASQTMLNVLSAAKLCLLQAARRAAYDAELRAALEAAKPRAAPPSEPAIRTPVADPAPGPNDEVPNVARVWQDLSSPPPQARSTASTTPGAHGGVAQEVFAPPKASDDEEESSDAYSLEEPIPRRRATRDGSVPDKSATAKLLHAMLAAVVFVTMGIAAAVVFSPSGEKKTDGDKVVDDKAVGDKAADEKVDSIASAGAMPQRPKAPPPDPNGGRARGAGGARALRALDLVAGHPEAVQGPPTSADHVDDDRSIDLLKILKEEDSLVTGWRWERSKLVSDPALDPHFLPLPFDIPKLNDQDAYRIEAVVERKAFDGVADGCLVFSLPGARGTVDLMIDLNGQRSGIGRFESSGGSKVSGLAMQGQFLPMEAPQTIRIQVARNEIHLDCGGHHLSLGSNAISNVGPIDPAHQSTRPADHVAIGANQSFELSKLELKSFNPNEVFTVTTPQRDPSQDAPAGADNVNLLSLIRPERDTFAGQWRFEGGELVSAGFARQWRTIEIPFRPTGTGNYRILLRCAGDSPQTTGVVMGLLNGARQFTAGLDTEGKQTGLTMLQNRFSPEPRFVKVANTPPLQQLTELTLLYTVGPRPWFTCNQQIVGATPDRFPDCVMDSRSVRPAEDRLFLSCRGARFTVRQLEYQPITGTPPPAPRVEIGPGNAVAAGAIATPAPGGAAVPITPGAIIVTDDTPLVAGNLVDTEWHGQWWKAQVLDVLPDKSVQVHYLGRDASQDEVVSRDRLRLPNANVARNRFVRGANFGNNFQPAPAPQNQAPMPITPSPILVANETSLQNFDEIEIQSGTLWWKGHVLGLVRDGTVRVRYDGRNFDEVVTRSRLRIPRNSRKAENPDMAAVGSLDARPVPLDNAVADALEKVKNAYKKGYDQATSPEQKLKLADQLLGDVTNQKDDALAYAMLHEARQLALDAGNWQAALKAADKFDTRFQTGEPGRLQADVMLAAARAPGDEQSMQQFIETAMSRAQTMIRGLTYSTTKEVTEDFVKAAILAAQDSKPEFKNQVLAQATRIRKQIRDKFPTAKPTPSPFTKPKKSVKSKR